MPGIDELVADVKVDEKELNKTDKVPKEDDATKKETDKKKTKDTTDTEDHPSITIKDLAEEMGWNPDFQGEDFVTAEDFIRRGGEMQRTMRDHMRSQKSQIADLKQTIEDAKAHYESVYKVQVKNMKKELTRLKKLKNDAIEDGDTERVAEIDEQIDDLNKIPDDPPKSKKTSNADPEVAEAFNAWHKKNQWYGDDEELTQYADAQSELDKHKGLPYATLLKKITENVKAMFPDKFPSNKSTTTTTVTPKKNTVASPTNPGKRNKGHKYTFNDLSPEQQKLAKSFEKKGIMTVQEYVDDLVKIGQLGGGK